MGFLKKRRSSHLNTPPIRLSSVIRFNFHSFPAVQGLNLPFSTPFLSVIRKYTVISCILCMFYMIFIYIYTVFQHIHASLAETTTPVKSSMHAFSAHHLHEIHISPQHPRKFKTCRKSRGEGIELPIRFNFLEMKGSTGSLRGNIGRIPSKEIFYRFLDTGIGRISSKKISSRIS